MWLLPTENRQSAVQKKEKSFKNADNFVSESKIRMIEIAFLNLNTSDSVSLSKLPNCSVV